MMRNRAAAASALLSLCFVLMSGCAPTTSGAQAQAQLPPPSGAARVWFLRQFEPGEFIGWSPWLYINGQQFTTDAAGTAFYRDFPPGTYTFSVQSCGQDTNQAATLQLVPGIEIYLETQSLAGFAPYDCVPPTTFYERQISPRWAQLYLPQLRYLGPR
ncbi:MAG: hypothetical protein JO305_08695 [Alphaproteobacteria bacterium]|nr:hypothetical protein [Alphaproteobacteria bacterium]